MDLYDKCPFCGKRLPVRVTGVEGRYESVTIAYDVFCRSCKRNVRIVKEARTEPLEK